MEIVSPALFKMGHKEVETTCNINSTFGPGAANKGTVPQRFRKFCQGDERLADEESSGHPSKTDKDRLRAIIKADRLTTTQEIAKKKKATQRQPFYSHSAFEANWKGDKARLTFHPQPSMVA
ncbi:histone-lysine N-methyltransferase SETMAR-like [Muntiacus reevesi]|uniref:histone-lysine N-methyltransferase SETMAR-like n=1 Tax=Muntiacus reevesi TaxID=9886 RepID=UPI0033071861